MGRRLISTLLFMMVAGTAGAGSISLFGTVWNQNDPGTAAGGGLRLTGAQGEWRSDVTFSWVTASWTQAAPGGAFANSFDVFPIDIGLRYVAPVGFRLQPYLGGGATYNYVSTDVGTVDNKWGWYGVAGLNWGNPYGIDFFVEAIYRDADTYLKFTDPVAGHQRTRVDLSGLGINLGVVFHL